MVGKHLIPATSGFLSVFSHFSGVVWARPKLLKEALSTTVLCALLFLFFPRIQFIARPIVGRPAFASQAVFYDKAGASASEILMLNMEEFKLQPNRKPEMAATEVEARKGLWLKETL